MSKSRDLINNINEDDIQGFVSVLQTDLKFHDLTDKNGINIFHEMASMTKPVLPYYKKLINHLPKDLLIRLLNSKTSHDDKLTPLQVSIIHYKKVFFTQLRAFAFIESGANPFLIDELGRNCLHLSVKTHNIKLFVYLLNIGVDLDQRDRFGNSPLHLAIRDKFTEFALIIIAIAKNLNILGENSNTPLHMAAERGNYRVVRRLLAFDADTNIKNSDGFTAKEIANDDAVQAVRTI